MNKVNIFLDDERQPEFIKDKIGKLYPKDWILVTNYFDFIKIVDDNIGSINLVSFDHDISSFDTNGKEWTGKDAVDYLIGKCLDNNRKFPDFYVHTMNVAGRQNIIGVILNYIKHVDKININWKYYNNGFIKNNII